MEQNDPGSNADLVLCHDCDLPNRVAGIPAGGSALCPRCGVGEPARTLAGESRIRRPVGGDDIPSLVAAYDAALGELADAIASHIASAP